MKDLKKILAKRFKERFFCDKSFKDITTFKIGGKIKFLVFIKNYKEIKYLLKFCHKNKQKYVILGGCSNVLCGDSGFDGVVILTTKMNAIKNKNNLVFAECGAKLGSVVIFSKNHNLSGLEWAIGIPGTVGGSAVMNAGAFKKELYDFVDSVVIFDGKRVKKLKKDKIEYGYRTTIFQNKNYIILGVWFSLKAKSFLEISKNIDYYISLRKQKQNITFPNAGSIFKKANGISAGKLIERCGLKGYRVGDAMISKHHAGFIVNLGSATQKDVQKLIDFILISVYNMFSLKLELEIKQIGE
ncbi:MAG: UDP-N-acetylmuramate dehydrogenase [Clostridia bacterium]|nr:UDP-N-acetylmuramate dehydrogenase [Clostridia bacterium]